MTPLCIAVRNPSVGRARLWRRAQGAGLALLAMLVVGLWTLPETTLSLFWNVVIPVLPAAFLINPALWRNVCPLATLNKSTGDLIGRRTLPFRLAGPGGAVGIALLFLLVPARRFLFNTDGPALALTITAVALLATLAGTRYLAKAGFCNSWCPVLPVERLYGQRPLVEVSNARCAPCSKCSIRGCLDLAPTKSIAQTLGPARRGRGWLLTPFGLFAASFPGFVLGYSLASDGPFTSAPAVYTSVLCWAAASFLLFAAASVLRPTKNQQLVTLAAAAAFALYYWFAAPNVADALSLPEQAAAPIRLAALGLVTPWLRRGWKS